MIDCKHWRIQDYFRNELVLKQQLVTFFAFRLIAVDCCTRYSHLDISAFTTV